jgi:hypothetical protein
MDEEAGNMSIKGLERDEGGFDDGEDLLLVGRRRAVSSFDRNVAEGGSDLPRCLCVRAKRWQRAESE